MKVGITFDASPEFRAALAKHYGNDGPRLATRRLIYQWMRTTLISTAEGIAQEQSDDEDEDAFIGTGNHVRSGPEP